MKWMNLAATGRSRLRPLAGLYLRTPKRTRFWGWGDPRVTITISPAEKPEDDERPFAAIGDWLRAAHSLFGSDQGQAQAQSPAVPGAADPSSTFQKNAHTVQAEEPRTGSEKRRRLRFVCNRHVIGFVFD